MTIEIQYIKEQSTFKINIPEEAISSVMASALDDDSVSIHVLMKGEEKE